MVKLHINARTTVAIRKEIHYAKGNNVQLAKRFNVSKTTISRIARNKIWSHISI